MTHAVSHAKTLVDVIHYWASERPTQEALRFYPQGEGEYISLTFAELHARCQIIASHLAPYHGKPALLLFNSGLNFLEALFACFYAGVIAVPAYPPRKNHHITRLSALIDDCQPAIVLSESAISTQSKHLFAQANNTQITQLPWLDADLTTQKTNTLFHPANENDLAFLQYTSGSTGKPKGVMLSHKNLMSNIRMAQKAFNLPSNARCVSWLPLFHDMGLIGSVMAPLYWGAGSVLMPPAAFLQKPLRWLKLLSEFGQYSPVGCTAPNFSYQLCIDSISDEQAAELDLSAWIFALSGAEPVRAQTLDAFAEKFAVSSFTKNAFVPAYGMAECSVLSTCRQNTPIRYITVDSHALAENNIMLSADSNLTLVSCGQSCAPQILKIVQSDTLVELAEGQVGEIWLQGEHIGQGYWQQAPRSQATFHAYTAANEGPFLRTGDLGCLIDGELFVTGRIKDLLIIRGKNYYPQDIEYTAMHAFAGLQLEHTAAFTIEQDGEEKLILVQELSRHAQRNFNADDAGKAISQAITREHGIDVYAIAFIRFASINKTSSGKIQRHACKNAFLSQTLNSIALWQNNKSSATPLPNSPEITPAEITIDELNQWIVNWLAAKTASAISDISLHGALDNIGLDSVDLLQLSAEIEQWLGQALPQGFLWEHETINDVSLALKKLAQAPQSDNHFWQDNEEVEGVI